MMVKVSAMTRSSSTTRIFFFAALVIPESLICLFDAESEQHNPTPFKNQHFQTRLFRNFCQEGVHRSARISRFCIELSMANRKLAKTAQKKAARVGSSRITSGAVPPEKLRASFPPIGLPIRPPYPPMEAKSAAEIPAGPGWLYEPKWDGFRCLAFRRGEKVLLQSKAGQPLGRYFPELVAALTHLPATQFVLDGEIVIFSGGQLSFDDLLMRIHPAASRIRKLSAETPATLMCFDLLVDGEGRALVKLPLAERRQRLKKFFSELPGRQRIRLSEATNNYKQALEWMSEIGVIGFDGIVAKKLDEIYRSGERSGMVKIKRIR